MAPLGTASGTLPLVPWARGRGPYRLVPWQRRASCRGTGACPDGGACVWAHCFHPPRDPAEAVPVMRRTEHTGQPVRQLRARWRYTLVDGRGLTRGRLDTGLPGSGGPAEYLVVDDESRAGASGTAVRVEYAVHVTWDQTDRLQLHARDWVGTARNPTACPGWIPGTCLDWELPDLPPNRWITLGRSEVRDFRGRLGAPAHEPQRWWSGPGAPP